MKEELTFLSLFCGVFCTLVALLASSGEIIVTAGLLAVVFFLAARKWSRGL